METEDRKICDRHFTEAVEGWAFVDIDEDKNPFTEHEGEIGVIDSFSMTEQSPKALSICSWEWSVRKFGLIQANISNFFNGYNGTTWVIRV
jgi:hypothetical protein